MRQAQVGRSILLQSMVPDWPFVVWMVAAALALALAGGLDAIHIVRQFNIGFGRALGEFALILLPSFTLAAVLSRNDVGVASEVAAAAAPLAGGGMICPDTAYASLSPVAGPRRLDIAFGAYAGGLNVRDRAFSGLFRPAALMAYMQGVDRIFPIAARDLIG